MMWCASPVSVPRGGTGGRRNTGGIPGPPPRVSVPPVGLGGAPSAPFPRVAPTPLPCRLLRVRLRRVSPRCLAAPPGVGWPQGGPRPPARCLGGLPLCRGTGAPIGARLGALIPSLQPPPKIKLTCAPCSAPPQPTRDLAGAAPHPGAGWVQPPRHPNEAGRHPEPTLLFLFPTP